MMNSLKKMIVMVIAFTMISGALLVMIPQAGESSLISDERYPDPIAIYADPELRYRGLSELRTAAEETDGSIASLDAAEPLAENLANGTVRNFIVSDETAVFIEDYYYVESMEKRGEGQFCEVWVATHLGYSDPLDPRNSKMTITDDNVLYIIDEYDENIYPIMSEAFTGAPEINGSNIILPYWEVMWEYMGYNATEQNITEWLFPTNDTGKLMIMIFNIKDESYYNPSVKPYIAGYYSSTMSLLYDRNIMHIDAYDWANRTGEQDESIPGHYSYSYESTVAHEYQHLLHDWVDGGEDTWVNEGLSMMAEPLCGYPIPYLYVNEFISNSTNSLVDWGDQGGDYILADYGAAYMFMQYLADHYGGLAMLQAIFNSMEHGTDCIDDAFLVMGHNRLTFERAFHDWRLANLALDLDMYIPGGLYYYNTLESEEVDEAIDISRTLISSRWDQEGNVVGAYGTDYIHVTQGDGWEQSMSDWWYSGSENNLNTRLLLDLDMAWIDADSMTVNTYYDTETYFDYVQIQVSTDGGKHWSTLYEDSGYYEGYLTIDLSDYKSQEIMVGFLYTMDGSVVDYGWDIYGIVMMDDGFDTYYVDLDDLYVEDGFATVDLENKLFMFDGDDEAPQSWIFDGMGEYWYSGDGDEIDHLLTMEVDLTAPAQEEGAYLHWLNLSTYWNIEANWDFGFVQVSVDGGPTWISLNDTGNYCTEEVDIDVMPSIAANVPGLTGDSENITDLSFDLSAYDGQEILVGFRYMTDWASTYDGWFIFGAAVDGVAYNLTDMVPVYPEVDWMVTIYVPGTEYYTSMIIDIPVDDLTEVGYKLLSTLLGYEEFYVLVSPNMGGVDYNYQIQDRGMNYYMPA